MKRQLSSQWGQSNRKAPSGKLPRVSGAGMSRPLGLECWASRERRSPKFCLSGVLKGNGFFFLEFGMTRVGDKWKQEPQTLDFALY